MQGSIMVSIIIFISKGNGVTVSVTESWQVNLSSKQLRLLSYTTWAIRCTGSQWHASLLGNGDLISLGICMPSMALVVGDNQNFGMILGLNRIKTFLWYHIFQLNVKFLKSPSRSIFHFNQCKNLPLQWLNFKFQIT